MYPTQKEQMKKYIYFIADTPNNQQWEHQYK